MNELENETAACCADLDATVRENPTKAILLAVGAGLALAFVVRALQPRPPEHRAARLLADLRERLSGLADPALRRASGLASDGASLLHEGADHLSGLHLDRKLHRARTRLRNFFR